MSKDHPHLKIILARAGATVLLLAGSLGFVGWAWVQHGRAAGVLELVETPAANPACSSMSGAGTSTSG